MLRRSPNDGIMIYPLILEPLYPEMEEATIGQWLVAVGENVTEDQPLAELITDKVVYTYSSPHAGAFLAILATEKSVVPVGVVLAVLGETGEEMPELEAYRQENRRLVAEREAALSALHEATSTEMAVSPLPAATGAIRATPAARRLARERGVDLSTLTGSGPGGMITVEDIP